MIPAKYWSLTKKLMLLGAMAGGKAVEDTATGNPLTFLTDLAKPLKSLLIPFTPKQEGSGDPSPSNVRPIVPWDGLTVWNGGKNLFNKQTQIYNVIISSGEVYQTTNGRTVFVPCMPNTTYTVSKIATTRSVIAYAKTEEVPQAGDPVYGVKDYRNKTEQSITTGADAKWIVLYLTNTGYDETPIEQIINSVQLEVGSVATAYEPYIPITETDISFASPVYGGTLDAVTGVLTVEWAGVTLTGAQDEVWSFTITSSNRYRALFYKAGFENAPKNNSRLLANYLVNSTAGADGNGWIGSTGNFLCYVFEGITTESDWRAYLAEHPLVIAYELEEPFEIQLTPQQITALVGNNTLWSDADGSMTAVYLKKA